MTVLVTGAAGFIGAAVTRRLLSRGDAVVGVDNHNDYYDVELKEARLALQLPEPRYTHVRLDLSNKELASEVFEMYKPRKVVHLAAQAGVRFSMENPSAYIQSNLVAFGNVLEECRRLEVGHLVYASSSSVYGSNQVMPYSVNHNVDHPLSLYAATKKSNELMAHAYSHLYRLPATALRFFTVYGPWGRPDMAPFLFVKAIIEGVPIKVYNYGNHRRDFTYIDDIVEGVVRVLDRPPTGLSAGPAGASPGASEAPWRVYNIGSSSPVGLMAYIAAVEDALGITAKKEFLPMQPGDVLDTYADVSELINEFGYCPSVSVVDGVRSFVEWYREFYYAVAS